MIHRSTSSQSEAARYTDHNRTVSVRHAIAEIVDHGVGVDQDVGHPTEVFVEYSNDFPRVTLLGEGGETAKVAEQDGHLAVGRAKEVALQIGIDEIAYNCRRNETTNTSRTWRRARTSKA